MEKTQFIEKKKSPKFNVKKKSLKKKSPHNLSIRQSLMLEKLKLFYENGKNIRKLLDIVNSNSKISLRIIDWFVTNYSKKNFVIIGIKKISITSGKTKKKTHNITEEDINVFLNYKAQLKSYSKKQFDPFCRRERISFKYNDKDSIITTVGQLNFFKWAIENNILDYIDKNLKEIEDDMNQNIKKPNGKKKSLKKNDGYCYQSSKSNYNTKSKSPNSKGRKKRRELSTSAVKSLNKHEGNIVLSFD